MSKFKYIKTFPKTHKVKKGWMIFLGVVLVLFLAFHLLLEPVALHYANKAIDRLKTYEGHMDGVGIQLYRGAYRIDSLTLHRVGDEDTISPFFSVDAIEISVSWRALFKGKIVADVAMYQPVLNFKATKVEEPEEETNFVKVLEDMVPIRIETFKIYDGEIHYLDKAQDPVIDVYFKNLNATADNLTNMERGEDPLPSKVSLSANTIGGGTLNVEMGMYLLQQVPDFDLSVELADVDLVSLNDFTRAYAYFDFEKGTFYLSTEVVMNDGDFKGYLKPVLEDYAIIDLSDDDPFSSEVWETLAGSMMWIFENKSKDRFASRAPFKGNARNTDVGVLKTLANVWINAFVEAFEKNVEDRIEYQNADEVEVEKEEDKGFFEQIFSGSDDDDQE